MKPNLFLTIFFAALISTAAYTQGNAPIDTTVVDENIFEQVEYEATFPGGTEAWINFLVKTVNSSVAIDNGAPIGVYTVVAQFIVNKDGTIVDIKTLTNHGFGMEQEVIRTLKLSGKWSPAIQNGRPVKAYRKQPITFQVEANGITVTSKTPYVLYTATQNEVSIKVNKVKPDDLLVTISQGSIIHKGNGEYIVKVNKPGKAVIQIVNGKKNKMLRDVSFEVKAKE